MARSAAGLHDFLVSFNPYLRFLAPSYNSTNFMDTITKPSHQKTTDTLRQALATLAALMDRTINEVNVLDVEIQDGIQNAVRETQESLEKQSYDRQQLAIEEAVQKTRALVSEEFFEEMQKITDECARATALVEKSKEEHLKEMADTEEAAAVALERQVARAVERVKTELTGEIESLKSELERANQLLTESKAEFRRAATEKESVLKDAADKLRGELELSITSGERTKRLLAEAELTNSRLLLDAQQAAESVAAAHKNELADAVERVRTELTDDRDRLNRQLDELLHSAAEWDSERDSLKEEARAALAAKDKATADAKVSGNSVIASESLQTEVHRVEESIRTISAIIDAPETELSLVIRKNVERAELEAYLKGIKFAVTGK
jgi:uncharacterized protein YecT (DUF1311 family)